MADSYAEAIRAFARLHGVEVNDDRIATLRQGGVSVEEWRLRLDYLEWCKSSGLLYGQLLGLPLTRWQRFRRWVHRARA